MRHAAGQHDRSEIRNDRALAVAAALDHDGVTDAEALRGVHGQLRVTCVHEGGQRSRYHRLRRRWRRPWSRSWGGHRRRRGSRSWGGRWRRCWSRSCSGRWSRRWGGHWRRHWGRNCGGRQYAHSAAADAAGLGGRAPEFDVQASLGGAEAGRAVVAAVVVRAPAVVPERCCAIRNLIHAFCGLR